LAVLRERLLAALSRLNRTSPHGHGHISQQTVSQTGDSCNYMIYMVFLISLQTMVLNNASHTVQGLRME
jgi:hypothetical protein